MREQVVLPPSPVEPGFLDGVQTLVEALVELARRHPDYPCLVFADRSGREERLTLGALRARAAAVQACLEARGVAPGDHVVLVLPTGPELVAAYFGVLFAGAIPALASTPTQRVAAPDAYRRLLAGLLACGPARAVYCDARTAELRRGDGGSALGGALLLGPDDAREGAASPAPVAADPARTATIQFSSGSTGAPKGIRLSHRAMLDNIRAVRDGLGLTPRDVSVNWIPLYHDMGLIDAFLLPLLSGCPTVLIPTTDFIREPRLWLDALHRYRGTISWAPNFAYALCVQRIRDDELAGLDLSSWRIAINAAEPVLARTIAQFSERFAPYGFDPRAMTPAWGLAENVTIATAHPVDSAPRIERIDRAALARGRAEPCTGDGLDSVAIGRCLPRCKIEIRDGGRLLGEREVGEVWLASSSLFEGYHRAPERTAQVLRDGWLNTGDRGYVADGDLFFVARDKDLIVIAGEKYAPHDLETVINEVPGVREGCAVVFGVLDDERGTEVLGAVVETKLEDPDELAALERAIRTHVTRTTGLALRHLKLVPPGGVHKTTSGKLARSATRERYLPERAAPA